MSATASDKLIGTLYSNGVIHYGTGAEKVVRAALDQFIADQKAEEIAVLQEALAKTAAPADPADVETEANPEPGTYGTAFQADYKSHPVPFYIAGAAEPEPEDTHALEIEDAENNHGQGSAPEPEAAPEEKPLNQVLYDALEKSSGDDKDAGDWTQTGDGTDYPAAAADLQPAE